MKNQKGEEIDGYISKICVPVNRGEYKTFQLRCEMIEVYHINCPKCGASFELKYGNGRCNHCGTNFTTQFKLKEI